MAAYRRIWSMTAGLVGCVGVALALVAVPPEALAGLVIFGLLVGSAMTWALMEDRPVRPVRRVFLGAFGSAGVMVVVGGLGAVLGVIGLLVWLVTVVTSPVVLASLHRLSRRERAGSSGEGSAVKRHRPRAAAARKSEGGAAAHALFAIDATVLDDATLCAAWQMSIAVLEQTSATDLGRMVEVRRHLLDELERRHPATFSSWLAAAPGATDDLTAYLTDHDNPPPTAGSSHGS